VAIQRRSTLVHPDWHWPSSSFGILPKWLCGDFADRLVGSPLGQGRCGSHRSTPQAKMKQSSRSEVIPMAVRQPRYSKEEAAQPDLPWSSTTCRGNHAKSTKVSEIPGGFHGNSGRAEEFAQRGDALYESEIRQQVEEGNHGKIVAIDIETGAFEVADEILEATDRLFERIPDAQPWIVRIGHRAVHRFGARSLRKFV